MKYLPLLLLCSLFFIKSNAQTKAPIRKDNQKLVKEAVAKPPKRDKGTVFTAVAIMPEFVGGEEELYKYIGQNVSYPKEAIANKHEGTVYLSFVVWKDGSIRRASILRDIGFGCGAEALRVIKNMPKWRPGKNNGIPVNVEFTLPVQFKLAK